MNHEHISKQAVKRTIRLCGSRSTGYLVLSGGYDGLLPIAAPTARIGHAIVRALRELAGQTQQNPKARRPGREY